MFKNINLNLKISSFILPTKLKILLKGGSSQIKHLFCTRYCVRHIHTLSQLMITTIFNVFMDEDLDLEELDILPKGTQLVWRELGFEPR